VHFISGLMTKRVPFIVAELGPDVDPFCGGGRERAGADFGAHQGGAGGDEGQGSTRSKCPCANKATSPLSALTRRRDVRPRCRRLRSQGRFLGNHRFHQRQFQQPGFAIIGLFDIAWIASYIIYRVRETDPVRSTG
jgi:hypothetical protein